MDRTVDVVPEKYLSKGHKDFLLCFLLDGL